MGKSNVTLDGACSVEAIKTGSGDGVKAFQIEDKH